jgi:hypothetical protein
MSERRNRLAVRLGLLPCTSEPLKNSTSPGSIGTGRGRVPGGSGTVMSVKLCAMSAAVVHRIGQRWLPGTTSRQPLASSARSSASHAATQVPGLVRRKKLSWCSACPRDPGGLK